MDMDVQLPPSDKVQQLYEVYRAKLGAYPPPDEDVTMGQLISALSKILSSDSPPFVDFAIWGPHGHRLYKRLKLRGSLVHPDGRITAVELTGPGSFPDWASSWAIFKTGAIMLNQISPAQITGWADVRAKSEWTERTRLACKAEYDQITGAGGQYPYEPDRPWDVVFAMLVDDY
eukprot:3305834-Amphidinium_carterae.1